MIIFLFLSALKVSGGLTSEIEITLPSAGETMTSSSVGVNLSGSLKKYTHQMDKMTPSQPRKSEKIERIIVTITKIITKGIPALCIHFKIEC